jgi:hypothetical protein
MSTKIENPIIRRAGFGTPLFSIVEISILPGDPEVLELSVRNPRQTPTVVSVPLPQALERLFPDLWGSEPEEPQAGNRGVVDGKSLEDAIMVEGEFTVNERARFFNLVRQVQKGER